MLRASRRETIIGTAMQAMWAHRMAEIPGWTAMLTGAQGATA
jgi:hypothetical protein